MKPRKIKAFLAMVILFTAFFQWRKYSTFEGNPSGEEVKKRADRHL
ncbi:MAG: hypothetical protein OXB88_04805 [Bacteriovoracales bacterium]|nr:hypothetical protein [Bacteriovoracales bacterium]